MIVAAREAKYKEHVNDHQKQILETFSKEGYILALNDFNDLAKKNLKKQKILCQKSLIAIIKTL